VVTIDPNEVIRTEIVNALKEENPLRPYRASHERKWDLLHTKLEVKFDFKKHHVIGRAHLILKPYFYKQSSLTLDAKGMDIHNVMVNNNKLNYTYDSLQLSITLDRNYNQNEELQLIIDYTAKPDELPSPEGSLAIISDKGLYFIDPDSSDPYKPTQIWTQGETESNSCWFPTIDKPNERCTQEINITVNDKFTTLSNGILISSTNNNDGSRTDYWKLDIPHAPYLFMMAIGEFSVTKDVWRGKEISYYLEPQYGKYAKDIFRNLPEMMEFYSTKITGINYPWPKLANIAVRDYISGAMENTSAIIYHDGIQQTLREMLDFNFETTIAHELFHHWFGDLVTCESWSNIPLNESFANYSEYLWIEYKYGKEEADWENVKETRGYMRESQGKNEILIRYYYNDKEEMFDGHSYNKGGRILHMLRQEVGDDAFFASLKKYLEDNKFNSVEIHNLRLAFEEVTGRDLNWFFNQWFLDAGHPLLDYDYSYDEITQEAICIIKQKHNIDKGTIYRLPMAIDVYVNKTAIRHEVVFDKLCDTFKFKVNQKPDFIHADARRTILCEKKENKSIAQYITQFQLAPNFLDRYEAIVACGVKANTDQLANDMLYKALYDKHYAIRIEALEHINLDDSIMAAKAIPAIVTMAHKDGKSSVRVNALKRLKEQNYKDIEVYQSALKDSSYNVISAGLKGLNKLDKTATVIAARELMDEPSSSLANTIMQLLSESDDAQASDAAYFDMWLLKSDGYAKYNMIGYYATLLTRMEDELLLEQGITTLTKVKKMNTQAWIQSATNDALEKIRKYYQNKNNIDKIKYLDTLLGTK